MDQYPELDHARHYHAHSQQQWQVARASLQGVSISGSERVLDVGCGSGRIAAHLAGRVPEGSVVGIDISQGMVAFCRAQYGAYYPNLSFTQCGVEQLEAGAQFDLVCSFSTLHWCQDIELALTRLFEASKPYGKLVMSIPAPPQADNQALREALWGDGKWSHVLQGHTHPRKKYPADQLAQHLETVGFSQVSTQVREHVYLFENRRAIADWFAGYSPLRWVMSADDFEAFLVDAANAFAKVYGTNANGEIPCVIREIEAQASKPGSA